MELIDKVDINDKVIGITNKVEAHENGYIHRVAAVFVFNPDNKLLVQLRKKDGLLDHSIGGHVRQGESYDKAVIRESKEELGIFKKFKKVGIFYGDEIVSNRNLKIDHYFGLYEVKLTDKELKQMVIAKDEVEKIIPMSLKDIAKKIAKNPEKYTTGFMRTLNFYINKHKLAIPLINVK